MEEYKEVKVYGYWISQYRAMVEAALKLKGVAYEYFEEDLANKSEALLRLNPVHKKVPVLVVDGKPIAESLVILQFIEETWKEPAILPKDAYLRAKVRFWADFVYQKMNPQTYVIARSQGEAQAKAVKEFIEHLITLDDGISNDFAREGPFINGEHPGLLDIVIGSCSTGFKIIGNELGIELFEKTPLLSSVIDAYENFEVTKATMVPYDKFLERVRARRQNAA